VESESEGSEARRRESDEGCGADVGKGGIMRTKDSVESNTETKKEMESGK